MTAISMYVGEKKVFINKKRRESAVDVNGRTQKTSTTAAAFKNFTMRPCWMKF